MSESSIKKEPSVKQKKPKASVKTIEERFVDSLLLPDALKKQLLESFKKEDFEILRQTPASHDWKIHELLRKDIADYSRNSIAKIRSKSTAKEFADIIDQLDEPEEASWMDVFHLLTQINRVNRFHKFVEENNTDA